MNNKCPKGHGVMRETEKGLFCSLCGLVIPKEIKETPKENKHLKNDKE